MLPIERLKAAEGKPQAPTSVKEMLKKTKLKGKKTEEKKKEEKKDQAREPKGPKAWQVRADQSEQQRQPGPVNVSALFASFAASRMRKKPAELRAELQAAMEAEAEARKKQVDAVAWGAELAAAYPQVNEAKEQRSAMRESHAALPETARDNAKSGSGGWAEGRGRSSSSTDCNGGRAAGGSTSTRGPLPGTNSQV